MSVQRLEAGNWQGITNTSRLVHSRLITATHYDQMFCSCPPGQLITITMFLGHLRCTECDTLYEFKDPIGFFEIQLSSFSIVSLLGYFSHVFIGHLNFI